MGQGQPAESREWPLGASLHPMSVLRAKKEGLKKSMAIELSEMAERLRDSLDDNLPGGSKAWTRGLAAGSLLTGAVLLATGRRRAGLAVTAVGSLAALLEESDAVRELWDNLPDYIHTAQEALGRFEGFVQDLAEQGDRIRRVIRDQARV
ncbi:MAG TPA: hypothetical protein VF018_17575 [Acidobacteriaceae bacterium]